MICEWAASIAPFTRVAAETGGGKKRRWRSSCGGGANGGTIAGTVTASRRVTSLLPAATKDGIESV